MNFDHGGTFVTAVVMPQSKHDWHGKTCPPGPPRIFFIFFPQLREKKCYLATYELPQ